MGKIVALVNQKGGVGKTTTAINLAACLAVEKKKTLLIDTDTQGNATSGLGFNKVELDKTIYEVLIGQIPIEDAILHTELENLDLIASNVQLAGASVELVELEDREMIMRNTLAKVKDQFDFIFIDCPPSLGLITLNNLTAADSVIIPLQCEYYALEGMSELLDTIMLVQNGLNPSLGIEGILMTMYDIRTNLSKQVVGEVKSYFKDKVYNTIIPRNVRLGEAPSFGKPIILYDSEAKGAKAYIELARELISQNSPQEQEVVDNAAEIVG
jgi:chromosome partitioning protein